MNLPRPFVVNSHSILFPIFCSLVHHEVEDTPRDTVQPSPASLQVATESDGETASDASDDEDAPQIPRDAQAREAERLRVLQAAGVLSSKPARRRPPPPPSTGSTTRASRSLSINTSQAVLSTAEDSLRSPAEITDDAYERFVALQRNLPPLPSVSSRQSVAMSSTASVRSQTPPLSPPMHRSDGSRTSAFFSRIAAGISRSGPSPQPEARQMPSAPVMLSQASTDDPAESMPANRVSFL